MRLNIRSSLVVFMLLLAPCMVRAETFNMDNLAGDYKEIAASDVGRDTYIFSNTVDRYTAALLTTGVHYTGGAILSSNSTFTRANLRGSPILGAFGPGTVVRHFGTWDGDGGLSISSLVVRDGGKWIVEASAEMNFIQNESLFTRQLWVYGDGTGTLELAEGFVADHTQNGTVADGLGSIRLSNSTLITHHTQSLPVAFRPDGSGGLQTNGHLVFENEGGSNWITRTRPQVYSGAVWIAVDTTFHTETDLAHTGTTQYSSHSGSYWAANAFQTVNPDYASEPVVDIQLTKTGPADLVLAAESAFVPGTIFTVEEGGLVFRTDPAAGIRKYPTDASMEGGPNLVLVVGREGESYRNARVRFEAPLSRIASLTSLQGRLEILGEVWMETFSSNSQDDLPDTFPPPPLVYYPAILNIHLDAVAGQLTVSGDAALGGELLLTREPGFDPPVGTVFDLVRAGSFSSGPNGTQPRFESVEDRTGLGLVIEYLPERIRATTTRRARSTGVVIDEDWTDGAFDASGWRIVDARVNFHLTGRTEIPMALARPVDTGFIWNAATLDVPGFFVGEDEVLVIRMTTFSDVAYNNAEYAKPEVACLHLNTHAQFGHDHATEISRNYFTSGNWQQLKPSVENDDTVAFAGIHLAGGDTATTLSRNDTSLVVFRPVDSGTNAEGWGMRTSLERSHSRQLQHWDNILISIPHSHQPSKGPVLRSGVSLEEALIGMSQAHVGITARSDANLDYATDALDFMYWNSYYGDSGTLLLSGDFNNDGTTDGADLAVWETNRGTLHDPLFNRSVATVSPEDLPGTGPVPVLEYNANTGELILDTNGGVFSSMVVPAPPALSSSANLATGGAWWHAHVASKLQWADSSRTGVSGAEVPLAMLPAGLSGEDFDTAWLGYASGGAVRVRVVVTSPAGPTRYEDWVLQNGLTGPDAEPGASPFGDGVPNVVKFGFGLPLEASREDLPRPRLETVDNQPALVLRFTRPAGMTALATTAEVSRGSPDQWSADPAEVSLSTHNNGDGTETLTARTAFPSEEDTLVLLRILFQ